MNGNGIVALIYKLGLPTAVAAYLLLRLDTQISKLIESQQIIIELLRIHVR